MSLTTDRDHKGVNKPKGEGKQNEAYLVLSEEERAKGFVRPVRRSYIHKGKTIIIPKGAELTPSDQQSNRKISKGCVAHLKYPESEHPVVGRDIEKKELSLIEAFLNEHGEMPLTITMHKCGASTKMAVGIAETYARDPKFYSATWCTGCGSHYSVEEFVWEGTDERVGS